jgi:hypothetical protein
VGRLESALELNIIAQLFLIAAQELEKSLPTIVGPNERARSIETPLTVPPITRRRRYSRRKEVMTELADPPPPIAIASPAERAAAGKTARAKVPRSSHGEWEPPTKRRDPVEVLEEQARTRVPELVPIRYGRIVGLAIRLLSWGGGDHGN